MNLPDAPDDTGQIICPKCGNLTANPEVCDICGALLNRILERASSGYEPPPMRPPVAYVTSLTDPDDEETSSIPWPAIAAAAVIIAFIGAGYWFFVLRPTGHKDAIPASAQAEGNPTIKADRPVEDQPAVGQSNPVSTETPTPSATPTGPNPINGVLTQFAGSLNKLAEASATPTPVPTPETAKVVNGILTQFTGSLNKLTEPATPTPRPQAAGSTEYNAEGAVPQTSRKVSPAAPTPMPVSTTAGDAAIDLSEETFANSKLVAARPANEVARMRPPSSEGSAGLSPLGGPAPAPDTGFKIGSTILQVNSATFHNEVFRSGTTPVLVYFFSKTSSSSYSGTVESLAGDFASRLKIVKLDVDANASIAGNCRVQSWPTLVLFKNGREMRRVSGSMNYDEVRKTIESAL